MAIIGRTSNPEPESAVQQPKPQQGWWKKAIDVLTIGEQFSSGVLTKEQGEGTLQAGMRGVREDLTGIDVVEKGFEKATGRKPETLAERAQVGLTGVVVGGAIDPLTYIGIAPIAKLIGKTSKFALGGTGITKSAAKIGRKIADNPAAYKALTYFNQGYDIAPDVRKTLMRATVEQELSKGFARNVGGELKGITSKLTPAQNKAITSYLTGQIDDLPKSIQHLVPKFDAVRKQVDDVGQELVSNGLLDVDTYRQGLGKWLPKMYDVYDGNRPGLVSSFFGKGAADDVLEQHGVLRTLSRNVLDEFKDKVNAKVITQGGEGGDFLADNILGDLNIYSAKNWDDLKSMLKKSDNAYVSQWYNSNRGVVDEAIDAYKQIEKKTGMGMYDWKEISAPRAVEGGGGLNLATSSLKKRHGSLTWRDGGEVKSKNLLEPEDYEKLVVDLRQKGLEIIDADAPVSRNFQEAMGIIEDPAILVEKALEKGRVKIPIKRLFDSIKKNEAVLDTKKYQSLVDSGTIKAHKFIKVPDSVERYGDLSGKWIKKSVWENVLGSEELSQAMSSAPMQSMYKGLLQSWKAGVTIMNPASHMRQLMSNVIFLDMKIGRGPMPGASIAKPLTKTAAQFSKLAGGQMDNAIKEAQNAGLFLGTFGGTDFGAVKAVTAASKGKAVRSAGKAVDFMGNLWNKNDNFFRMAAYNYYRGKGFAPEKAVAEAHQVFFNYADVPRAVKTGRDYIPFLTFGYKSTKFFLNTLYHNPSRIAQWYRLENAVSRLDPKNATVDPSQMRDYLADQVPISVDAQGRQKRLSMQYIYPWGTITSSNPLGTFSINPAIKEGFSQAFNYDPFFQQKIGQSSVLSENIKERAAHVGKTFTPPAIRKAGDIINAAQGQPNAGGQVQSVGQEVLSGAGVKTTTVDIRAERRKKRKSDKAKINAVQREISEVRKDKSLSKDEKAKRVEKLRAKLRQLRESR